VQHFVGQFLGRPDHAEASAGNDHIDTSGRGERIGRHRPDGGHVREVKGRHRQPVRVRVAENGERTGAQIGCDYPVTAGQQLGREVIAETGGRAGDEPRSSTH
jgi:hypothetical protein